MDVALYVRVYMDLCCLKRPFDDQRQPRLQVEAEAVLQVLDLSRAGKLRLIGSPTLRAENLLNPNPVRRDRVSKLLDLLEEPVVKEEHIKARAQKLIAIGFKPFDALHVAWAEGGDAHHLLTTDDRLVGLGRRRSQQIELRILDPIRFLREVLE